MSPTVAASYRAGSAPLPPTGFRAPAGAEDEIHVFDHLGTELLASLAPPFVAPAARERYEPVATKVAGVDLTVAWTLRRWPGGRDGHQWVQEFRDGIEQAGAVPDERPCDLAISCDYRDFARFLVGAATFTQARSPVRITTGGVTELSCLHGLVLGPTAIRQVVLPVEVRTLLGEGIAQL